MEAWVKILLGLGLLCLSLGYLYRPGLVLKFNALVRNMLFNDAHLLLYRRRWGLFAFMAALLFFYSGFNNLAHQKSLEKRSSYLDLGEAYRAYRAKNYSGTVAKCQEIIGYDARNLHAWALLASAWAALGNQEQSEKAWAHMLKEKASRPQAEP